MDAIERLCDGLVIGARRRADVSNWLLRRFPDWQLFVTVLSETHSAGEQLWHGVDPTHPAAAAPTADLAGRRLREVYRAVDDAVGRLLAGLDDDVVTIVFSMHGAAGNLADVPSMVLLPELLWRLQTGTSRFVDRTGTGGTGFDGPVVPDGGWTASVRGSLRPLPTAFERARRRTSGELARAKAWWRHRSSSADPDVTVGVLGHPILPETTLSPEEVGVPRSSVAWQIPLEYQASWPELEAFALPTFYDGRIRLNVRGRERDGIVAPEDYERVCDRLEREILACRHGHTGEPLVARIDRLRADDPLAPGGPDADLQVVWATATDTLVHPVAGRIGPVPYRRTGGHSPRGFAFVAGPGIEPGDLGTRSVLDVTATVVEFLGRPSATALEGVPLVVDPDRAGTRSPS